MAKKRRSRKRTRRAVKAPTRIPRKDNAGLVFVACLFIGMGLGALFGATGTGTLLGLGVGFLAMFNIRSKR